MPLTPEEEQHLRDTINDAKNELKDYPIMPEYRKEKCP